MTFWVSQKRPHGHRYIFGTFVLKRLICQSFSAFSASSLKNVSAVSCSHSFSEAVLLFSLSFLRLICSEHYCHLLEICSEACCFSAFFTLLHNDIIYYKHKSAILSRAFDDFLINSSIYNAKKFNITPKKCHFLSKKGQNGTFWHEITLKLIFDRLCR